jgi:hypothetical protein
MSTSVSRHINTVRSDPIRAELHDPLVELLIGNRVTDLDVMRGQRGRKPCLVGQTGKWPRLTS